MNSHRRFMGCIVVCNLMLGGGMMADGGVISRLPRKKVHYQVETIFEPSRRIICEAQDLLESHSHAHTFILILCSVAFEDKEDFVSKRFCEL